MPPQPNNGKQQAQANTNRAVALPAIVPNSVAELIALADTLYKGGLAPKGCTRPESVAAIICAGLEVGLRPAQALNCMYMVNGKAVIYGDAPLALVRASGLLESIEERIEGGGEDRSGICTMKRKGDAAPRSQRYSAREARAAGLFMKGGKAGPWDLYTDRMLMFRARGWLIRDLFGDVLSGLALGEDVEEQQQTTAAQVTVRPAQEASPPPPSAAEPPTDVHGEVMITDDQIATVRKLVPVWLKVHGPNPPGSREDNDRAWQGMLRERYGVESAAKLTESQAAELIGTLREAEKNPTAALFSPAQGTAGQAAPQQQQTQEPTTAAAA